MSQGCIANTMTLEIRAIARANRLSTDIAILARIPRAEAEWLIGMANAERRRRQAQGDHHMNTINVLEEWYACAQRGEKPWEKPHET